MENSNFKHPSSISLFNLYDKLSFPSVNGKTVKELIEEKSSFFEWALNSSKIFCFDDYTIKYIEENEFHLSDKAKQNQTVKREKFEKDTIEFNDKYEPITDIPVAEGSIKLYKLDYKLGFGNYSDKTIEELIELSPSRVEFYIQSLDWFGLTQSGIEKLSSDETNFVFLKSTFDLLNLKYENAPEFMKGNKRGSVEYYDDDNYYDGTESEYAGTWAYDVEGLSDDFINDVLDGDPDAYWNID